MKLNLAGARRQKELSRLKSGFDFDEIIVLVLAKVGKHLIIYKEENQEEKLHLFQFEICRKKINIISQIILKIYNSNHITVRGVL